MKWLNDLTHKILSDQKLLWLIALIFLLVYPLKRLTNARICEDRNFNNYPSSIKYANDKITQKYFKIFCD